MGYCYRWQYTDSTNETEPSATNWVLITDTAVTEALADAAKAQATADGKMTVYSSLKDSKGNDIEPDEGDLLIPTFDLPSGATGDSVQYGAGKIYRYVGESWVEVVYSD